MTAQRKLAGEKKYRQARSARCEGVAFRRECVKCRYNRTHNQQNISPNASTSRAVWQYTAAAARLPEACAPR